MTPTGLTGDGIAAIRGWLRGHVAAGRLPGATVLVARGGRVELAETCGLRDRERGLPMEPDTLVRIYSMTKPIVAVAALALAEDGALDLDEPVARTIPAFATLAVNRDGTGERLDPVPARTAPTVRHLLTHTAGLTYGEGEPGAVSRLYVERRTDFGPDDGPLAAVVERLATIPLVCEPGSAWTYGVASDVLGRVVEVAAGQPLDVVLAERVLGPLGMRDTGFAVAPAAAGRLAALYEAAPDGGLTLIEEPATSPHVGAVATLSGGAGLISTAPDYLRFAEALRRGGELDGSRVLRPATVAALATNQLPGDLAAFGTPSFNETTTAGVGYGLGVSVVVDPTRTAWHCGRGELAWGGYASSAFWVDPEHDVSVVLVTQVIPSDALPLRAELRALVHDALA